MGTPAVGTVVLVLFPYADFKKFKNRPALVIGHAEFGNIILCQITSQSNTSKSAVRLADTDFKSGGLSLESYIRTDKIFTVESSLIKNSLGLINSDMRKQVKARLSAVLGL